MPAYNTDFLDEIMSDLGIYENPELLKEEYQDKIRFLELDKTNLNKYSILFYDILYAWKKVLQYPKYFEYLYCSTGHVDDLDALNHHIHGYLEDLITLRNKVEHLLDVLKKDLKKFAINKQEVESFFQELKDKNYKTFDDISRYRNPHRHHGTRFVDTDLIKAETVQVFLESFNNPSVDILLNQEYKPKAIERLLKEQLESFEKAKKRWIVNANDNNLVIKKYLDFILKGVKPMLYKYLKITPIKEVISLK